MERHYGMDWLRIGAFALLILYHIGMVFVPWGFHVKTQAPLVWAEIPMFLTNPWRLTLLFVVSGYASRALLARSPGLRAFVASRSARLLISLAFGIAVVVPPQSWVEISAQHGYARGFAYFWAHDYFRFGTLFGIMMPTWNHLWFVLYLWVYSMGLAAVAALPGGARAQALFDRVFAGWRALAIPAAYMVLLHAGIFPHHTEDTHDLVNDGVAHLRYVPAFLFGFGLAGSRAAMDGLARHRRLAASLAIASFATIAALLVAFPDFSFETRAQTTLFRYARAIEMWSAIAALIGIAETHWNRDHRWRATLAEATFPFYIAHQTLIVVIEHVALRAGAGPLAQFGLLIAGTVAGCWAFYLAGRRIGWLRPLIGLKQVASARASAKGPRHDGKTLDADGAWRRGIDDARAPA